jgi:hypothetical protein
MARRFGGRIMRRCSRVLNKRQYCEPHGGPAEGFRQLASAVHGAIINVD